MAYSIGIVLLIANLVVIGAGYGYSAPSVPSVPSDYGASDLASPSAGYGPVDDHSYETVQPEPETPEVAPEIVVEPANTKEQTSSETTYQSLDEAFKQGYEQGFANGQQSQGSQGPAKPTVASTSPHGHFPTGFQNLEAFNRVESFNQQGFAQQGPHGPHVSHGPQQHYQGPHRGPMRPNQMFAMRPIDGSKFDSNPRPIIQTSGPGLMFMTGNSAGPVPLTEEDDDIPPNMVFGIGNRKPVQRPFLVFGQNQNKNSRPNRFGFGFTTSQTSPSLQAFNANKFNGVNNFVAQTGNNRFQGFDRFNQNSNTGFNHGFRNRRSVWMPTNRFTNIPAQFW